MDDYAGAALETVATFEWDADRDRTPQRFSSWPRPVAALPARPRRCGWAVGRSLFQEVQPLL